MGILKKYRKIFAILLVLSMLVFMFTGCSTSKDNEKATSKADGAKKTPSVGLVLVGSINDGGWNASAYEGLMQMKEKLGAKVTYAENIKLSDMAEVMRTFATEGYDYVIGHGFETFDPAVSVSAEFPKTRFIVNSCNIGHDPNVAGLDVANKQHGFLAGVVAAKLTKTKVVGVVGGMEIPSISAFVEGAKLGIQYVNPSIKIIDTFTGSFDDVALAKEVAMAMVDKGADVICPEVSQADLGVYEAAQEKNIMAIGSITDQYERAPENIPTSVTMSMSVAMYSLVSGLEDGSIQWGAKPYEMGVAQGVVEILASQGIWVDKFPKDAYDWCKRVEKALGDGTLNINDVKDATELSKVE